MNRLCLPPATDEILRVGPSDEEMTGRPLSTFLAESCQRLSLTCVCDHNVS